MYRVDFLGKMSEIGLHSDIPAESYHVQIPTLEVGTKVVPLYTDSKSIPLK